MLPSWCLFAYIMGHDADMRAGRSSVTSMKNVVHTQSDEVNVGLIMGESMTVFDSMDTSSSLVTRKTRWKKAMKAGKTSISLVYLSLARVVAKRKEAWLPSNKLTDNKQRKVLGEVSNSLRLASVTLTPVRK